jgi:NOL1/NOP2/fmu family ribosome biogenesis protein
MVIACQTPMSKISFFYESQDVYKMSLRALERRNFKIDNIDEAKGIIIATSKKKMFKPSVQMKLEIIKLSEQQTVLEINSEIKKTWLTPDNMQAQTEHRFVQTLYRCFEKM